MLTLNVVPVSGGRCAGKKKSTAREWPRKWIQEMMMMCVGRWLLASVDLRCPYCASPTGSGRYHNTTIYCVAAVCRMTLLLHDMPSQVPTLEALDGQQELMVMSSEAKLAVTEEVKPAIATGENITMVTEEPSASPDGDAFLSILASSRGPRLSVDSGTSRRRWMRTALTATMVGHVPAHTSRPLGSALAQRTCPDNALQRLSTTSVCVDLACTAPREGKDDEDECKFVKGWLTSHRAVRDI